MTLAEAGTGSELRARHRNACVNGSRYALFSKISLKAFCLHVFHIPDRHLTSAASSGQLAAGLQQREAVSRDMAWLFMRKRSVQRKGCGP